ncbi:MAG TPA: hypothetical protein VK066_19870 [Chloroflexota bacterium]|nr:hypothetical protein [Chloroflexota bacterium]
MTGPSIRIFAAAVAGAALLAVMSAAPAPAAAATVPAATSAAPHQYVGYGYYGYPSPYGGLSAPAVNYPGSGASAWFGYSYPYSSSGYPYGGYAYPYVAYSNPYAAYQYGVTTTSPYSVSPGYPYSYWDGTYGNGYGSAYDWPSSYGGYYSNGAYYVAPQLCGYGASC